MCFDYYIENDDGTSFYHSMIKEARVYTNQDDIVNNNTVKLSVVCGDSKKVKTLTTLRFQLSNTIKVGRVDHCKSERYDFINDHDNDMGPLDKYVSEKHLEICNKEWYPEKQLMRYNFLMKIRLKFEKKFKKILPLEICRYIYEFTKEDRFILVKDLNSRNGTYTELLPLEHYNLESREIYYICQTIQMKVQDVGRCVLHDDNSPYLEDKLEKQYNNGPDMDISSDYCTGEEIFSGKDYKTYHYMVLDFYNDNQPFIFYRLILITNRDKSSRFIGTDIECQIRLKSDTLMPFQCEIFIKDKKWYIRHNFQDYDRRIWKKINDQIKINKTTVFQLGCRTRMNLKIGP